MSLPPLASSSPALPTATPLRRPPAGSAALARRRRVDDDLPVREVGVRLRVPQNRERRCIIDVHHLTLPWGDEALDRHLATAHIAAARAQFADLVDLSPEVSRYHLV